ncbi:defense protein l(2)34Fc-like [Mytilus californianus]|uniref:defense protein l(2)34Fc-like n=1 Tax=Mytilus californianus TaxID=6549 RepID=UPI002246D858|nr:defense protein l(2)34Fc-like [Mytilus californianus]
MSGFETCLKIVLLFCCLCFVHAYPTGAPTLACQTRTPQHNGTATQNRAKPYTVTANSTYYTATENVLVTIKGTNGANFKGFLIQMRTDNQQIVGTFTVITTAESQLLQCNNVNGAAITHTNNNDKTELLAIWTPPAQPVGNVKIEATVVQDFQTFWTNIVSTSITPSTPSTTTTVGGATDTGPTGASSTLSTGYVGLIGTMFALYLMHI